MRGSGSRRAPVLHLGGFNHKDLAIKIDDVEIVAGIHAEAGDIVELICSYDPDTLGVNPADGRKVRGVIHWVEATQALPAEFRVYDRLFSVANPAAEDDFLTVVNPQSLVVKQGLVEPSLQQAKAEQAYQFEREGYYCADNRDSTADKLVFNRTVGLRDSWGKEED
mgnify:CR=1 FL=1